MDYLPHILTAYGVFLLGVTSPGPNSLAIMGTSMTVSRRAGLISAVGIATGTLIWSSLSVTGLTLVLTTFAELALALKIAGGCYLIYVGVKSLRSAMKSQDLKVVESRSGKSGFHYYRRGFLVQVSNPKAALFWLSIMSLVLQPGAPHWVGASIIIGTTILSGSWYGLLALLFSTNVVLNFYRRARRSIDAVMGGLFMLIGGRILLSS